VRDVVDQFILKHRKKSVKKNIPVTKKDQERREAIKKPVAFVNKLFYTIVSLLFRKNLHTVRILGSVTNAS
jgi:hypothetical protein